MTKKQIVWAIAATVSFSISMLAQRPDPPDRNAFGLALGEPFMVQECPVGKYGFYSPPKTNGPCFTFGGTRRGNENLISQPRVVIEWPALKGPELALGGKVSALIIEGRVESVALGTLGLRSADRDLKVLSEKYGNPHDVQNRTVQTATGTFESTMAFWIFEGLTVTLDTADGRIDRGRITIETPAGQTWQSQQNSKQNAEKVPL